MNRSKKLVGAGCAVMASFWAATASAIAFACDELATSEPGLAARDVSSMNRGFVPDLNWGFVGQGSDVSKAKLEPGSSLAFAYQRVGTEAVAIQSAAAFSRDRAGYTSFAQNDSSPAGSAQRMAVETYFAGRPAGSIALALSPLSLDYQPADFGALDRVVFRLGGDGGTEWILGVLEANVVRVPDGGLTAMLLGLGVLGLGLMRRMVKQGRTLAQL